MLIDIGKTVLKICIHTDLALGWHLRIEKKVLI